MSGVTNYASTAAAGAGTTAAAALGAGAAAGPIGLAIGGVVALIGGIFGHHSAAVKNEAAALNYAVPATEQSIQQIFGLVNSGQLDTTSASSYLDQTLSKYEATVYEGYGVKKKSGNGPDVVEGVLRKAVEDIKSLFSSGKSGSVTVGKTYANAGYQGTSEFTLSYSPASSSPVAAVESAVKSVSSDPKKLLLLVGAVVLLFLLVKK